MVHHHRHRRSHRRRRHGRSRGWGGLGFRGRFFGPGEVRFALLSLLGERPQHGYELMKALEERSGGAYRASAGTIYPTLQQLADEGLVVGEEQDGRRSYALTEAGRAVLAEEEDTVLAIWERAERWREWGDLSEPDVAEVIRPALRLLRSAVRTVRRNADPATVERVREILRDAQREVRALRRSED